MIEQNSVKHHRYNRKLALGAYAQYTIGDTSDWLVAPTTGINSMAVSMLHVITSDDICQLDIVFT